MRHTLSVVIVRHYDKLAGLLEKILTFAKLLRMSKHMLA